jgi:hypothetical protein
VLKNLITKNSTAGAVFDAVPPQRELTDDR